MLQLECYSHEFWHLLLKVTQTEVWWRRWRVFSSGHETAQYCSSTLMFQRNYPNDGGSMFLWNLRHQLPDKMKSYPTRPQSKSQPNQEHLSPSPVVTVISLYSLSNLYKMHVYLAVHWSNPELPIHCFFTPVLITLILHII